MAQCILCPPPLLGIDLISLLFPLILLIIRGELVPALAHTHTRRMKRNSSTDGIPQPLR